MTVRITESRLPNGYVAADLGEYVSQPYGAGRYVLVGYLTSPFRVGTYQDYVLFAIDAPADEYRWRIEGPGGSVSTRTTSTGTLFWKYDQTGTHQVRVEVWESGALAVNLDLEQELVAADTTGLGVSALQTRDSYLEQRNDLRNYMLSAAEATGQKGIPARFLSAILYQESGGTGPHRGTYSAELAQKSGHTDSIREVKADSLANEYEAGRRQTLPDGATAELPTPPIPRAIGPGNLILYHIASMAGAIPFLEADVAGSSWPRFKRRLVVASNVAAFRRLPYESQVDAFNLARFPQTSLAMVAKFLTRLKNRPTRWPNTDRDDVLADPHLIEIVASEYGEGATTTPAVSAKPNGYGNSTRDNIQITTDLDPFQ